MMEELWKVSWEGQNPGHVWFQSLEEARKFKSWLRVHTEFVKVRIERKDKKEAQNEQIL